MQNSYQEFHLGALKNSFVTFVEKYKYVWRLLILTTIAIGVLWAFGASKAYAKEHPKKQVDTFYLVQEYLGEVKLYPSEPHRLSCVKDKCTLLKRDTVVNNFFTDKKCKEIKISKKDFVIEYSCGASDFKKRVMEISGEKYFKLLLEPVEERKNTKV